MLARTRPSSSCVDRARCAAAAPSISAGRRWPRGWMKPGSERSPPRRRHYRRVPVCRGKQQHPIVGQRNIGAAWRGTIAEKLGPLQPPPESFHGKPGARIKHRLQKRGGYRGCGSDPACQWYRANIDQVSGLGETDQISHDDHGGVRAAGEVDGRDGTERTRTHSSLGRSCNHRPEIENGAEPGG